MNRTILGGLVLLPVLATAQTSVPAVTTQLQAAQYAESAVADPVPASAAAKRDAAMAFMEEDHTVHVPLCSQLLHQMTANTAANAKQITRQYIISSGAYVYTHPEASQGSSAANVAGLNAAATVYANFLQADPHTRSGFLDKVVAQQSADTLKQFVATTCK